VGAHEPPVIDVGPLTGAGGDVAPVAAAIDAACRDAGFFSIVNHGIGPGLLDRLEALAREFYSRPEAEKARVAMANAGRAWRGWFPLGGELTSGVPDRKEGYYFGQELPADDPRVVAGVPLHGPNLFPSRPPSLGSTLRARNGSSATLGPKLGGGQRIALVDDA
jgi:isopenicillin N synthase-like dioxygenase